MARLLMRAHGMTGGGTSPYVVPPQPEGMPKTKAIDEDAAHFLIRMVHRYPHEVTIYEGGPMTDLAQAISIDPQFPNWRSSWCLWEEA